MSGSRIIQAYFQLFAEELSFFQNHSVYGQWPLEPEQSLIMARVTLYHASEYGLCAGVAIWSRLDSGADDEVRILHLSLASVADGAVYSQKQLACSW